MAVFELQRFRDAAFGRGALPEHPLQDEDAAREALAQLPEDPVQGLAELTGWATSLNAAEGFTPGRRARILMQLDDAAHPRWRALGERFLAPRGKPLEGRDGEAAILKALFDSASEFNNGYAIALDAGGPKSEWLEQNFARVMLRNLRWLTRRLDLAHMLRLPVTGAIWERLHLRYRTACERGVERAVLPVFPGDKVTSSIKQEYARALLLELADPRAMRAREIELAFRITARIASHVQLEPVPLPGAVYAVLPWSDQGPVLAASLGGNPGGALYFDTGACLPRLQSALDRDADADPQDRDTLYGPEYTVRERRAMLRRLLEHWGAQPPRRRARRVPLAAAVRLLGGFEAIAEVVPALEQARTPDAPAADGELRLQLADAAPVVQQRSRSTAARQGAARVLDASTGGLGIAVRRADAAWAKLGLLVGIYVEPGPDWVVGVLRRIYAVEDELRLGIQVLAHKPRLVWLRPEQLRATTAWEEEKRFEKDFDAQFQRAILPSPLPVPLEAGEFLLAPGTTSRGSQYDVPLGKGAQRVRVTALRDDGEFYQRAAFEPLSA